MKAYGWFKKEYDSVKNTSEFKLAELESLISEKIVELEGENRQLKMKLKNVGSCCPKCTVPEEECPMLNGEI